jgi:Uma2 family endonuclease
MAMLVLDPNIQRDMIARRQAWGVDQHDEVWEGTYVMSPMADNEHQEIQMRLASAIQMASGWKSPFKVYGEVNVSDQEDEWEHNYRVPDVVVVSPNTKAKDCGRFWFGGPDFVVEITSPHDRSRDKFDFYAKVQVQELVILDRGSWSLELYRLTHDELRLEGLANLANGQAITSNVLGLTMRLVPGEKRPLIEVAPAAGGQTWLV